MLLLQYQIIYRVWYFTRWERDSDIIRLFLLFSLPPPPSLPSSVLFCVREKGTADLETLDNCSSMGHLLSLLSQASEELKWATPYSAMTFSVATVAEKYFPPENEQIQMLSGWEEVLVDKSKNEALSLDPQHSNTTRGSLELPGLLTNHL